MNATRKRRPLKSETIRCRVDPLLRFRLQQAATREFIDESDVIRRALAIYLSNFQEPCPQR